MGLEVGFGVWGLRWGLGLVGGVELGLWVVGWGWWYWLGLVVGVGGLGVHVLGD